MGLRRWRYNDIFRIMADAAITVLSGIADAQTYLEGEGLLEE